MIKYILILTVIISCQRSPGISDDSAKKGNVYDTIKPALSVHPSVSPDFKRDYAGTIGSGIGVALQFVNMKGIITGTYQYKKTGLDIPIRGSLQDDRLLLYEVNAKNDTTAIIDAVMYSDSIKGTWQKLPGATSYPLLLKSSSMSAAVQPSVIEGTYVFDDGQPGVCNLQIRITKVGNEYAYQLETNKRHVKGKLTFLSAENPGDIYIQLMNLPWDSYHGDISKDKTGEKAADKPQSLEALYSDGAIDIQNSGNAMNSYEKLNECSEKYIHLERKK